MGKEPKLLKKLEQIQLAIASRRGLWFWFKFLEEELDFIPVLE